jgi:uncharacterized membrane protein
VGPADRHPAGRADRRADQRRGQRGGGALLAKLVDTGIKNDRIAALRETVPPGSTALALLVSHLSVADLQRELARFPGATLVESDLPDAAIMAVRHALGETADPA